MTNPTPRMPDEIWALPFNIKTGYKVWMRTDTQVHGVTPTKYVKPRFALPAPETVESLLLVVPDGHRLTLTRMATRQYWEMRISGPLCPDTLGGTVYGEGATAIEAIKSALGKLTG